MVTFRFEPSKTWPGGNWSIPGKSRSPSITHAGSTPSVILQLNTATVSGGINITLDGPSIITAPDKRNTKL